ncbi:MAG: nuclear transport factor 2 family protein [Alphaproteobacteria bacterium]|nr:nuclear transport factor 2 family protein [Alphaproteobacteria bacterium]
MSPDDHDLVQRYYDAMRAGPDGHEALLALFAEDAVYVEPFSGAERTHRGHAAIRAMLRDSQADAPPDLVLVVHRIEVDAGGVFADWSCSSPVFPAPVHGTDRYVLRDGRIARLETRFTG